MWTPSTLLCALLVALCSASAIGWAPSSFLTPHRPKPLSVATKDSTEQQFDASSTYRPIFDFAEPDTVAKFDRIDDVVMGGVSSSTLMDVTGEPYAKWFGNCRIDGGGFCGLRTLPFENSLNVADVDGFYLDVRLASDNEPERRAWKMTTRVKPDRGEQLYQSMFNFPQDADCQEWSRVKVPFSSFKLVRGPRMVPGGPPLDVTGGLYQIGMTMSKFGLAENTTEIENFRPGFFELQIKEIGVYKDQNDIKLDDLVTPKVLSKDEASKRRPLVVKLLLPVSKLFFTEQRYVQTITRISHGIHCVPYTPLDHLATTVNDENRP